MIDTHSHINFDEYKENFEDLLCRIKDSGVEKVIIPGVEPDSFNEIITLCNKYDMLYNAIGIHPSEAQTYTPDSLNIISGTNKTVAIGEIGLDYYWETETKELQKQVFNSQLETAAQLELPVLIHDREAHEDTFAILQDFKLKDVVFHCFSGDIEFVKKCLDKGYYIAIGGIITFKNAQELKSVVKYTPLNKLLLETDAPYLAPVPYRGKINSPEYLIYIAKEIALIKNIDPEEVKTQTTCNAKRIFKF